MSTWWRCLSRTQTDSLAIIRVHGVQSPVTTPISVRIIICRLRWCSAMRLSTKLMKCPTFSRHWKSLRSWIKVMQISGRRPRRYQLTLAVKNLIKQRNNAQSPKLGPHGSNPQVKLWSARRPNCAMLIKVESERKASYIKSLISISSLCLKSIQPHLVM